MKGNIYMITKWFDMYMGMSKKELRSILPVYEYVVCSKNCSPEDVDKLIALIQAIQLK